MMEQSASLKAAILQAVAKDPADMSDDELEAVANFDEE